MQSLCYTSNCAIHPHLTGIITTVFNPSERAVYSERQPTHSRKLRPVRGSPQGERPHRFSRSGTVTLFGRRLRA